MGEFVLEKDKKKKKKKKKEINELVKADTFIKQVK